MDIEKSLISALYVQKGSYDLLVRNNVSHELFHTYSDVQEYIVTHQMKYSTLPDPAMLKKKFGFVVDKNVSQKAEYYIDELKMMHKSALVREALRLGAELVEKEPERAELEMMNQLQRALSVNTQSDVIELTENVQARIDVYDARRGKKISGIPSGLHRLDIQTSGFEPGLYYVFFGRPQSMKTWLQVFMAQHAWESGADVLFITREMTTREIARRRDCHRARVRFLDVRDGTLTDKQFKAFAKKLSDDEGKNSFTIVGSDSTESYGVSFVRSQIQQHRPRILFLDGAYLMTDDEGATERTNQLANISRGMKQLCKTEHIPIVVTTQANRKGDTHLTGSTVFGSDAFLQDADVLVALKRGIQKDPNMPSGVLLEPWIVAQALKVRDGEPIATKVNFDFDTMDITEDAHTTIELATSLEEAAGDAGDEVVLV